MQHGNEIPLSSFLDFLPANTFLISSSIKVSITPQVAEMSAPSTQSPIAFSRAAIKKMALIKKHVQFFVA